MDMALHDPVPADLYHYLQDVEARPHHQPIVNKFVDKVKTCENDGDVCVMDFSHSIKPTLLASRWSQPF